MTIQSTAVGSAVPLGVLGVATASSGSTPGVSARTVVASQLAFTGVSHTAILAAVAVLLILTGILATGLSRRHRLHSTA